MLQRQVLVMGLNQLSQELHQMDPGIGGVPLRWSVWWYMGWAFLLEAVRELSAGAVGGEDGGDVVEVCRSP